MVATAQANLFPAYAGVIPNGKEVTLNNAPFPRTCGGDPNNTRDIIENQNFSPHVRG